MLKELKTGELQDQKNNLSFDEFGGFDDVDSLVTFDDTEFEVENIKNRDLRKLGSVARGPVLKQINDPYASSIEKVRATKPVINEEVKKQEEPDESPKDISQVELKNESEQIEKQGFINSLKNTLNSFKKIFEREKEEELETNETQGPKEKEEPVVESKPVVTKKVRKIDPTKLNLSDMKLFLYMDDKDRINTKKNDD